MDENGTPLPEVSEPAAPPATTLKERFKGFALYHLAYSAILFVCLFASSPFMYDIGFKGLALFSLLSITLYFPLGMWKAKRGCWTVPTRRELCLAILQPCGVSILWALLLPLSLGIVQFYFLASFLFAAPSSCFVLCSFRWISGHSGFLLAVLFAAVLPPLLFALGSFFQAKRQNFSPQG